MFIRFLLFCTLSVILFAKQETFRSFSRWSGTENVSIVSGWACFVNLWKIHSLFLEKWVRHINHINTIHFILIIGHESLKNLRVNLVNALMISSHCYPVRIVLRKFLKFWIGFVNFLLEFNLLIAFLAVVWTGLNHFRVGIYVESEIRFYQTTIWWLAPFEIEPLNF